MITLRPHQFDTVKAMWDNDKGQIIVPTGGGKTMCMIEDALSYFNGGHKTVVVVAPRILLAEQLSCLLYTSPSPRDATLSRMPAWA